MALKNKASEKKIAPAQSADLPVRTFPRNLNACGLLEQFVPEKRQGGEKKPQVAMDKKGRKLVGIFMESCKVHEAFLGDFHYFYKSSMQILAGVKISNRDIQSFIVNLAGIRIFRGIDSLGGMFISALMNASKAKEFDLNTKPVPYMLRYFGYNFHKNAAIQGDLGRNSFENMCNGELTLHGSVNEIAELMSGGSITINGNAYLLAKGMNCGNITINGNLGLKEGQQKYPKNSQLNEFPNKPTADEQTIWFGRIYVNGNIYPALKERENCKLDLFQRGRQLVREGKVISQPENK